MSTGLTKIHATFLVCIAVAGALLAGCTSGPHPGPNNPTPAPDGKDGKEIHGSVGTSGPHPGSGQ